MKLINTSFALIFFALFSCGSSGNSTSGSKAIEETNSENTAMSKEDMDDSKMEMAGFQRGIVMSGKEEGSCPFLIDLLGGIVAQKVDPVDLPEEYQKDNMLIWVKIKPLRRANRCQDASPVNVTEIQVRKK